MHKLASAVLFGCSLFSAGIALAHTTHAAPPALPHVGRHAATPEDIGAIEQVVADFQAALVANCIQREPQRTEEKFYNVQISQDRHVAWGNFDYEFLVGDT